MVTRPQVETYYSIYNQLPDKRKKVLDVIRAKDGLALFQISNFLHWPINSVSGRVTELRKAGLVMDSGEVIRNPGRVTELRKAGLVMDSGEVIRNPGSGKMCTVWKAVARDDYDQLGLEI